MNFNIIDWVQACIVLANEKSSKWVDGEGPIGMSSSKIRAFLNNLCSFSDVRYLEIGVWKGSTFCAALKGNEMHAVAIDDWSLDAGNHQAKEQFMHSIGFYSGKNSIAVVDSDCFSVKLESAVKFNIFFFDGGHTYDDHYRSLLHFQDALDDEIVFIVDDWSFEDVAKATAHSIRDSDYELQWSTVLHSEKKVEDKDDWWNGIFVGVLKRKD